MRWPAVELSASAALLTGAAALAPNRPELAFMGAAVAFVIIGAWIQRP